MRQARDFLKSAQPKRASQAILPTKPADLDEQSNKYLNGEKDRGCMANYKIEHDHENCIGCGACVAVNDETWEMGDDGKSKCKKETFEESELPKQKEAAEACPVNVIHIINTENNEKLI